MTSAGGVHSTVARGVRHSLPKVSRRSCDDQMMSRRSASFSSVDSHLPRSRCVRLLVERRALSNALMKRDGGAVNVRSVGDRRTSLSPCCHCDRFDMSSDLSDVCASRGSGWLNDRSRSRWVKADGSFSAASG